MHTDEKGASSARRATKYLARPASLRGARQTVRDYDLPSGHVPDYLSELSEPCAGIFLAEEPSPDSLRLRQFRSGACHLGPPSSSFTTDEETTTWKEIDPEAGDTGEALYKARKVHLGKNCGKEQ